MFPGSAALIASVSCVVFVDTDIETHRMPTRYFALPVQATAGERGAVDQVLLFVSTDKGKTWHDAGRAAPNGKRFAFLAPKEGLYWFAQQAVGKGKRRDPAQLHPDSPGIVKVLVAPQEPTNDRGELELRARIAAVESRIRLLEERVEELELRARLARLERRLASMQSAADR